MKIRDLRQRIKSVLRESSQDNMRVIRRHWLSPTGQVITPPTTHTTANDTWGEDAWAAAFLQKKGIKSEYPSIELKDKFGFVELAEATDGIYISLGKGRKLTTQQQREARDFAIEKQKPLKDDQTGREVQETITRHDLKEVIKQTLRAILNEMNCKRRYLSHLDEAIEYADIKLAWKEDQSGEYIQINPDDSVWYIAHGRAREQIAPKGTGKYKFRLINQWMSKNEIFLNIWAVNDHGNVELYNRAGKALGGLAEQLYEMTTTGAVAPINLPGNVKGGWVASKGGSARGVAGSRSLGYELTPIGKKDMARKQDPVY